MGPAELAAPHACIEASREDRAMRCAVRLGGYGSRDVDASQDARRLAHEPRGIQSDSLGSAADSATLPCVVFGDFNASERELALVMVPAGLIDVWRSAPAYGVIEA